MYGPRATDLLSRECRLLLAFSVLPIAISAWRKDRTQFVRYWLLQKCDFSQVGIFQNVIPVRLVFQSF